MLLVHANQVVPADRLTDELWAGQPAAGAAASLHVRVSQQPGDHLLWLGDTDAMFGQIRAFLGAAGDTPDPDAETDRSSPSPAAPAAG
jgi:hypothetical protein